VHEIGAEVTSVSVGDPVICFPFISGGLSAAERAGLDTHAPDRSTPGITVDGGYAEYLLTNERAMLGVGADADLAQLCTLTDAGLAAYRACKRAASLLRPGDRVVVLGVGGLGHLAVQILRSMAAADVIAVDPSEAARELGRECGAHVVVAPDEVAAVVPDGVRAVLDFVGTDATAALGVSLLEFGGTFLAVGVGGSINLPLAALVEGEKHLEGVFVGTYTDLREVVALVQSGRLVPRVVPYRLEQANEALHDLAAGRVVGRAVLIPNEIPNEVR
jgi:D-arabinose 1-dehydrogenase-like Zn-dependent alcohol dehydrogenase